MTDARVRTTANPRKSMQVFQIAIFLIEKNIFDNLLLKSDLKNLPLLAYWVCCGPRKSVGRENSQPPLSSSSRVIFVEFVHA